MLMMNKTKLLILAMGFGTLTGCTAIGKSHFACSAPDGVSCESISGGYANATDRNIPGQRLDSADLEAKKGKKSKKAKKAEESKAKTIAGFEPVYETRVVPSPLSQQERPLRDESIIARVTVFPYEDSNGVLHDLSRFYYVIKDSEWDIHHTKEVNTKSFHNLYDFREALKNVK